MNTTAEIVIITALYEELHYILQTKPLLTWDQENQELPGRFPCYFGTLRRKDKEIRIAAITQRMDDMGLTDSAILSTIAIELLKPRYLLLLGICGGREKQDINIGDIIIPKQAFLYNYGKYKDGVFKKNLMSVSSSEIAPALKNYLQASNKALHEIKEEATNMGLSQPRVLLSAHYDSIACADLVLDDFQKIKELEDHERKFVAFDMESYAVLKSASIFNVKAAVIKSISDIPVPGEDRSSQELYRKFAIFTASETFYKFATETDFFLNS